MESTLDEFVDAHKHIVTALNMCETNNSAVVIVVLGRILAELACKAGMDKDVLIHGIEQSYDMTLAEEQEDAGEPH